MSCFCLNKYFYTEENSALKAATVKLHIFKIIAVICTLQNILKLPLYLPN